MKLLQYTVRTYIAYSVLILLVSTPIFYLVMHRVIMQTVDKALMQEKQQLMSEIQLIMTEQELLTWRKVDHDIEIENVNYRVSESFSTAAYATKGGLAKDYRHLVTPIQVGNKSYKLTIHKSLDDSNTLLKSIVFVQLFLLTALMVGLVFINRVNSRRIWTPFYSTLRQLKSYDLGRHQPIVSEKTNIDEFKSLEETVSHLIQKNQEVYLSQKEFTENASHETQTPLAIFRSKLELLMQTEPLTREQAELISDLDDASQRLARLNKSLVLLTKIENNQYPDTELLDVTAIAQRIGKQLEYQAEESGIAVTGDYSGVVVTRANKALTEMLVTNLLSNAIRYNIPNGKVEIKTEPGLLCVSNTGSEQGLDGEKVFDRFYKAGRNRLGTGLGLAIVRKICDLYHYKISYHFIGGLHTFEVNFGAPANPL